MANVPQAGVGDNDLERLPVRLSPSRASDFVKCPAAFYFKSILRIPTPATVPATKGTLAHEAFERIFDHPKGERTPENAVPYVRPAWEALIAANDDGTVGSYTKAYRELAEELGPQGVEEMIADAEELVRLWFNMENPNRWDPEGRELRLESDIDGVPIVGIIDRLDRFTFPSGAEHVIVADYKTGKVPEPDDRFLPEKFFGMKVYAVLINDLMDIIPSKLRLVYVAGGSKDAVREMPCDENLIRHTRRQLKIIWKRATEYATAGYWPTKKQPLCNWCDFQELCPVWHPELEGVPVSIEVPTRATADEPKAA